MSRGRNKRKAYGRSFKVRPKKRTVRGRKRRFGRMMRKAGW